MILTYSRDEFVEGIKSGTKIHTIREDHKLRWKEGMSIQHWRGNPRNVRLNPYQFDSGTCKGIELVGILSLPNGRRSVAINGKIISQEMIELLAINDGFKTVHEFWAWFGHGYFVGRIIHFTDFKYADKQV